MHKPKPPRHAKEGRTKHAHHHIKNFHISILHEYIILCQQQLPNRPDVLTPTAARRGMRQSGAGAER